MKQKKILITFILIFFMAITMNAQRFELSEMPGRFAGDIPILVDIITNFSKKTEFEKCKISTELNSTYAKSWYNLGRCYHNGIGTKQNYAKAFECYNKAIELDSSNGYAWNNLGNCYANGQGTTKNYSKALECYKNAIDLDPKDDYALYNLGVLYDNQGNYNKAFEYYKKAAEVTTTIDYAWYNLGICYEYGHGTAKNKEMATWCYNKAKEMGLKQQF